MFLIISQFVPTWWLSCKNMERSVSHHLYIARSSLLAPSHAPTPRSFLLSHIRLLTFIWIPTKLAMPPSCKSPSTYILSWFPLLCLHQAQIQCSLFYLREWVLSPPASLSWPFSYCKHTARLHVCLPLCGAPHREYFNQTHMIFFETRPIALYSPL